MLFQDVDVAKKNAAQFFNKNPESINQDIRIIQQWLQTQPHLPELMEEPKIANFLLLNKYSIEKTKQKIDMYYTVRSVLVDIFENSNPRSSVMRHFMDLTYCCLHPKTIDGLYRVYFIKIKKPSTFLPREFGLQCNNIGEVRFYEDCMVGDIIIFDMSTLTLHDLTKVTPVLVSKFVKIHQVYSMRTHQAYFINSPPYVGKLLQILKMIVKPKIFARLRVCQDDAVLREIFAQDELPRDYGGDGPSLDELNELMGAKLEEYGHRFDVLDGLKVDESKRPGELVDDAVLGYHGNFKMLNVD